MRNSLFRENLKLLSKWSTMSQRSAKFNVLAAMGFIVLLMVGLNEKLFYEDGLFAKRMQFS